MTTPINTFEDILAAMEQNPQLQAAMRQHVLDQEFLQLPALVRELQQAIVQLTQLVHDYIAATDARLEQIEARLERLEAGQARLEDGQTKLEAGQAKLEADVTELKTQVSRMSGTLSNLTGNDYEGYAAHFGRRRLRDALQVSDVRLLYQYRRQGQEVLQDILLGAGADQGPSAAERDDLEDADLIFQVYGPDIPGTIARTVTAHVVAESSVTIHRADVVRAHRRALVMNGIDYEGRSLPATAAVIGATITVEALGELERRSTLGQPVLAVGMTQDGQACVLADGGSESDANRAGTTG